MPGNAQSHPVVHFKAIAAVEFFFRQEQLYPALHALLLVVAQVVVNGHLLAQQGSPGAGKGLFKFPAAFPALVEKQVEHRQADEPDGENDKKNRVGRQHLSDDENRYVSMLDDLRAVGAQQV